MRGFWRELGQDLVEFRVVLFRPLPDLGRGHFEFADESEDVCETANVVVVPVRKNDVCHDRIRVALESGAEVRDEGWEPLGGVEEDE